MSSILDVLIKRQDVKKTKLKEIFNEWGGEQIPYIPEKFSYGASLVFHANANLDFYKKIVSTNLDEYIALTLEGSVLSEVEIQVNKKRLEVAESELLVFIEEMYQTLENITLIKFVNEEKIDSQYKINDVNQVIEIFLQSLSWDSPEGVIITK